MKLARSGPTKRDRMAEYVELDAGIGEGKSEPVTEPASLAVVVMSKGIDLGGDERELAEEKVWEVGSLGRVGVL